MLWLDAGRLTAAWKAHSRTRLVPTARLDAWYDASGNGLDFIQRLQQAQPRYLAVGQRAVVRFDGQDDFLGWTGPSRALDEFTLLVVAAPRSNAGSFRAFLAAHETGRNDYESGFTIDMNGPASERLQQLNVEGKGFGRSRNLLKTAVPFGEFHTLAVSCQGEKEGVRLYFDGQDAGRRPRVLETFRFDHLVLGARCYSNTADPPFLSGFLDGDIAEVLLYNRVLSDAELRAVHDYLGRKHAGLSQAVAERDRGRILRAVANPPPVQMLVPGFAVRQLPVELTNINNVRYRHDGKLLALAYNGNVYLLSDSDGDGLEDRADLFWDNQGRLQGTIGMTLTPRGYKHGNGLFVASKGKVSLLVDTDGDDRADKEIVVAQGWEPLPHGVDAVGVALDKEGSVYFGLGTANWANGYLLDKEGKGLYDPKSERGTILKVAPDFSRREILCTGIRFTVGMAFNRQGDLFVTDQEGATWLPNGNPLDELLHIQRSRHYGFPPRHPKHLPNVIDEPSVFDYGPQHQSTCGLTFNDGTVFGPAWWAGDALVCGESRGKLFRTQLVKTAHGYVAQNHLLARLNMLTVDACVSPKGDLVVAVHSGPPDWGTGPLGRGKLYKVAYRHPDRPQPVLAWAASPGEVRIAFDRPLDPLQLQNLAKQVTIEYGPHVQAGDRFEMLHPPYAVVQQQRATPRHSLAAASAQVTGDRRTLVLTTSPQTEAVPRAVTLPGLGRSEPAGGELPQHAAIDVGCDLGGVEAVWKADVGEARWSGWLPHLDPAVAKAFTAASAEHERLWQTIQQPGRLTLRTQLHLANLLQPAVQPGSTLDYTPAPEQVTLTFRSTGSVNVKTSAASAQVSASADGRQAQVRVTLKEGELLPIEVTLETSKEQPVLEVSFHTAEDDRPRALALRRFLVPWATLKARAVDVAAAQKVPELEGGNWARGREVFFSEVAGCSKCHQARGQGGQVAADLSNLVHRDYASVLRDIVDPSAALNPDYLGYVVALKDGRVLTGVPRSLGNERVVIGDSTGKEITVARSEIVTLEPSPVSIMPGNLDKALGSEKMRDLLTFLLTEPLTPAPLDRPGAPPPRRRAEVEAVLKGATPPSQPPRKRHILLVAGPKDHGPGEHDYPLWQRRWVNLLSLAEGVMVSTANGWPTPQQWEAADVVVLYSANPAWSAEKTKELDAFQERGGGLVLLHFAVNGRDAVDALAERIGLAWRNGASRFRHGSLDLSFPADKNPITRGFSGARFVDESYWQLAGDPKKVEVLASAVEDGQPRPMLWTYERGKGRVFVSILGHYSWTFDDPLFRILLLRGLAWAAGEPVDRWTALATIGARLSD
jgi:putative heme-binding domain-containing protein